MQRSDPRDKLNSHHTPRHVAAPIPNENAHNTARLNTHTTLRLDPHNTPRLDVSHDTPKGPKLSPRRVVVKSSVDVEILDRQKSNSQVEDKVNEGDTAVVSVTFEIHPEQVPSGVCRCLLVQE
eukprot:Blabericola_migrator_1__10069@NODE_5591_length_724_cov_45_554033_g3636_i0_p1_GENE_NODE_5591_length_724_cov_45_554033_g3636_i0NODE_5591_length_724_cov_45_554033_g3636_i0_p1_ORF_typecomplete_len123_score26_47Polysacc_syn_2C/PF08485_10/1_4e03Polysacc_syn_2C/PF08485_10/47Polysacc_syn_2C/PF08485_10/31_NODE_5591_length_724_cov_45_554033_g3636_i0172540